MFDDKQRYKEAGPKKISFLGGNLKFHKEALDRMRRDMAKLGFSIKGLTNGS